MADLQTLYGELRTFLVENNIPIAHSVENFDALINTFFGREEDNVWATDLMVRHFDVYRTEDGSIDPQAAVDINNYLIGIGAESHANFDASVSTDSGPVTPGGTTTGDGTQIPTVPLPQRTPDTIGGRQIPAGMRLIRITDPLGSDAAEMFLLVGDVFGVNLAYEIGDRAALDDQFGGIGNFPSLETFTQAQFDASDSLIVGTVDELGPESLQAQYERDIRALGFESPPPWLLADVQATTTFLTAVNEGWSPERTWQSLSSFDSFKQRFLGLDVIKNQIGSTSFVESIQAYTQREAGLRNAILSARGPQADVSQTYVSSLIASGWQPTEVGELLGLERRVRENPGALDNINQILNFQGIDSLNPDDFVSFLQDQDALSLDPSHTPSDIFEGVNDALRFQALLTEGIEIDLGFATELGTGTSAGIAPEGTFSRQAQLAAGFIAANSAELNFEKLGLTREDIIAASFSEAPEGGRPVSEVNSILEQFARERSKAAQGFSGGQSFIDASGRLRVQGFADFG